MRWVSILTAFLAVLPAVLPIAKGEDAALEELKHHLEREAPRHWQVHVRWRDYALLASFMPPYQEAFDLWYQPVVPAREPPPENEGTMSPAGDQNMGHPHRGPGYTAGAYRRRKNDS